MIFCWTPLPVKERSILSHLLSVCFENWARVCVVSKQAMAITILWIVDTEQSVLEEKHCVAFVSGRKRCHCGERFLYLSVQRTVRCVKCLFRSQQLLPEMQSNKNPPQRICLCMTPLIPGPRCVANRRRHSSLTCYISYKLMWIIGCNKF